MTANPREVIERLRALQELDHRIGRLDREITDGPKAVESFQRAVAAAETKIAQIEERLKLLRAQVKLRENEAKTAQTRIDRLQDQAGQVKNNKEFTALRSEVANARMEMGKMEDEALKIMEAVDAHEKALTAARDERAREEKKLGAEKTKVDAAIDGLRAGKAALVAQRPALTKDVPAEPLTLYDRLAGARGGTAVVAIEQDYCTGCMERLTRNDVYAIHNASRIVHCKSCGRILFAPA
jgi:predicted  nucleic acid-binding Zn-ribbon protein